MGESLGADENGKKTGESQKTPVRDRREPRQVTGLEPTDSVAKIDCSAGGSRSGQQEKPSRSQTDQPNITPENASPEISPQSQQ